MTLVSLPTDLRFDEAGLIPAVVRDARSRAVLMVAWMNRESLQRSIESGETWFWSRSRRELWHKGATSGNTQLIITISTDCDRDTLLVDVDPAGPACHTGADSCFDDDGQFLPNLMRLLKQRERELPDGSYTASLFRSGRSKILKKIGEEASEVIIAAASEGRERIVSEAADLLFHLSVLLVSERIEWSEIDDELQRRHASSQRKETSDEIRT